MSNPLFDRVALIGIGLIGSSLARVLRRDCPETRIVACARRAETLEAVRRLGIADETTDDPAAAVRDADLVVLATPLSAYAEIGEPHRPGAARGRDRDRCRLGQGRGDRGAAADIAATVSISCRATRSPAPSIPAPNPVSPSCSATAGAS